MLRGKICVVTGGAKGIGKGIIGTFAKAGCDVAFMDLDLEAGKRLQEDIHLMYGVDAFFFNGDMCMQDDVETFANAVIGKFERVDFLINNGCAVGSSLIRPINGEDFGDDLRKNLAVPFVFAKMFKPYFTLDSCIVNILNNVNTADEEERISLKVVRESAILLAKEMANYYQGIVRVNCVSPEKVIFKEQKGGQVATPLDVIKTVEFLCQEKANFINGENLVVDGGITKMVVYHEEGGWSFRKNK